MGQRFQMNLTPPMNSNMLLREEDQLRALRNHHPVVVHLAEGFHFETIIIFKFSSRQFNTQRDIY